jgi:hypothetical protein
LKVQEKIGLNRYMQSKQEYQTVKVEPKKIGGKNTRNTKKSWNNEHEKIIQYFPQPE